MADEVVFTDEQQTAVNNIIKERLGRAQQGHQTKLDELTGTITTLQTELDGLKVVAKKKTTTDDGQVTVDQLQAKVDEMLRAQGPLQAQITDLQGKVLDKEKALDTAKQQTVEVKKHYAITEAASEAGLLDLEAVFALTRDSIHYDLATEKFLVKDENGQERLNSSFKPMTLQEYYQEFASKKPYLVRSDAKGGAGSTHSTQTSLTTGSKYTVEQIFGPKSVGKLAQELKHSNPTEYARLKKLAQDGGII